MDDFSLSSLQESRNEWCSRLITILTPHIIEGLRSIFDEAWKLCVENDEKSKYLMTFQNFLTRVPKWNQTIIEEECKRIINKSNCGYIEDLITCVHIIQLKTLSCMRVGSKQKKVNINIPSLGEFIHKVYVNVARKVYTNVYLFEKDNTPLQSQRHSRELEIIVRECILSTIRDGVPIEELLRLYMSETTEEVTDIQEKEEIISEEPIAVAEENNEQESNNVDEENEKTANTANLHKITAANKSVNEENNSVSFNLNDKVFSFEKEPTVHSDNEEEEDHDEDDDDEDDDEDDKLKIGSDTELELDSLPFDDDNLNIESIPVLEEVNLE